MRNLLKLIKYLSFLLCLGFYLGYTALPSQAQLTCPNGQNPDGSCKVVNVPMGVDEDQPEEEEFGWKDMDAQTKTDFAKSQARYNAAGNSDEARQVYDEQQKRLQELAKIEQEKQAAKAQTQQARSSVNSAYSEKEEALKAAQEAMKTATPDQMKAANENLKKAKEELEAAKKEKKKTEKALKKEDKAAEKEAKKAAKTVAKEEKKAEKAVKKEVKTAEKDLKKADKTIEKLQKKCAKGKCDEEDLADLAAAQAKKENAQSALEAANQKANALNAGDQTTDAMEYAEGRDREQAAAEAADVAADELAQAKKDIADAQSSAPKMCSESEIGGNVFLLIACKATTTLADLRVIAYIISGFGMVALSYAAIFGKMNWKHLANIGIGLFLLSMMTPFIEYFTTGKDNTLRFGKYLPAGFSDIYGSDGQVVNCVGGTGKEKSIDDCPDVEIVGEITKKKDKWSLKDLKGSIQAGLGAVRNASDMYKAAKSTVSNVKSQVSNMKAAIKSGGGGLDGIINAAGAVANATGSIVNSGQTLANNLATNAGSLTSNLKDVGQTKAQKEQVAEIEKKRDALVKKCAAGNCSEFEQQSISSYDKFLESEKTGVNKWLENDGKGGGSTILSGINKVGNITNNVSNSVHNAANAANEGQSIGGDGALGKILGVGFGVGTAINEGVQTAEKSKENGMFDFKSDATKREEKAKAEQEAFQQTSGYVKNETKQGDKTIQTLGDGSVKTIDSKTGTTTTVGKDGTTTVASSDGTIIVKNKDGSKVVTDKEGNQITYDSKGNKTETKLVNPYNRPTEQSIKDALAGKKEEKKEEKKTEEKSTAKDKEKSEDKKSEKPSASTASVTEDAKNKACSRYTGEYAALKSKCMACYEKGTSSEVNSCLSDLTKAASATYDCAKIRSQCFNTGEPKEACSKCDFKKMSEDRAAAENAEGLTSAQKTATCQNACATANADKKSSCQSACEAAIGSQKTKSDVNAKLAEFRKTIYSTYGAGSGAASPAQTQTTAPKVDEGFKENIIAQCSNICGELPQGNRQVYINRCKSTCIKPTVAEVAPCIKEIMKSCETYKRQLDRGI